MNRKQLNVLFILLVVYAFSAFATYTFFGDQLAATADVPMPDMGVPDWVLGLANAGIVLAAYGILGLLGFWFARKLGLPGIFSEDGELAALVLHPAVAGIALWRVHRYRRSFLGLDQ